MKIANIHYTGFGGLGSVVNGLVTAPGAERHEWLMGYYGVAPLDVSHALFCELNGLRYEVFRPAPGQPLFAWKKLACWLATERPDAIICHSTTAIPACAWASWRLKVPLIAVEHKANELKSRSEWLGSRAAMMLADRVIVLTEIYAGLLARGLGRGFFPEKLRRVANGIDAELFHPRSNVMRCTGPLHMGMAARLAQGKHHALLIDIAPSLGIALEFAGDGELMDELRARAKATPGADVTFCGLIQADKMPDWTRGLDIYLHASKGETFSMSILQAMASGLPIIASDISGMDEIIGRDESCGLLVPNTPEAWCKAIKRLQEDDSLRMRMGQAARAYAVEKFSTSAMLDGYLDVIGDIMHEKNRNRH